jgi:hypothetical protein
MATERNRKRLELLEHEEKRGDQRRRDVNDKANYFIVRRSQLIA